MLNHGQLIWSAADLLRGAFKAHEFGDVVLPFTVLRRLGSVLEPTKQAILLERHGAGGQMTKDWTLVTSS